MSYITRNNFSYTRFTMLFKREFTNNRQHVTLQSLVLIGLMIAVEAFVTYSFYANWKVSNMYYSSDIPNDFSSSVILVIWIIGLFLFSAVMASFTCNNLATKATRTNALMSVGTQLEKYLSRAIPYTAGFFIFYCCAAGVVDMFRCLYISVATPVHPIYLYKQLILSWDSESFMILFGTFLLIQAFFTMVSAFAPKHTFIKGFCIAIGINMVLGIVVNIFFPFITGIYVSGKVIIYTYFAAAIVFSAAMHWIAYYRYKETDLQ